MPPRFFMAYFETTRKCNEDCPNCMTRLSTPPDAPELDTDEAKTLVIDEISKYTPNGSVAFSGGEFLLRPDALELLEHSASRGLYSFVNTGGGPLTPELIREIKAATGGMATFGFSLDSIEPDTQAECRAGSVDRLKRLMSMCDAEDMGYFVLVTVSKSNLHTLHDTVDFLKQRNIAMIRSPFIPRGAAATARDNMFSREDLEKYIHPEYRENPYCYVSHIPFFADPDVTNVSIGGVGISLGNLGCQAGRSFLGVSAEGDVAPCVHLLDTEVDCGNVRDMPLSEIIETSPILRKLREDRPIKGKCSTCRYGDSCRGCRALAYYATGDYLAEDPVCFFEPESVETRSPFEEIQTRNTKKFLEFVAMNKPWNQMFKASGIGEKIGLSMYRSAVKMRRVFDRIRTGKKDS